MSYLSFGIKWKIHNVFHLLLLKQDIIRIEQVNQNNTLPEPEREFEVRNNKVKAIIDSTIYSKEAAHNQMLVLHYLVL